MPKYLTIHSENALRRVLLESRWTVIARDARADWELTLFNLEQGRRWCEWDAPDSETVIRIFDDLGIRWVDIIEVEITTPSQWRLWKVQRVDKDANTADVKGNGSPGKLTL
jgi:hypothetical protein